MEYKELKLKYEFLTRNAYKILMSVKDGPKTSREIMSETSMLSSTYYRSINLLEGDGYVDQILPDYEQYSEARKPVTIALTDDGRKLLSDEVEKVGRGKNITYRRK